MEERIPRGAECHRHLLQKSRGNPQISVGDMIIVHDEGLPRSFWKLGRIKDLIVGKDGRARGATVSIAGKNRRFTSLNRPLQLLYPLEIHHHPDVKKLKSLRQRMILRTNPVLNHGLNAPLHGKVKRSEDNGSMS